LLTENLSRLRACFSRSWNTFFAQPFSGRPHRTLVQNDCALAARFANDFPQRRKRSRWRLHWRDRSRWNIGSRNNGRGRYRCRRLSEGFEKFSNPFLVGLHGCAGNRWRCRQWRCRSSICLAGTLARFFGSSRQQLKQKRDGDEQNEKQGFEMHLRMATKVAQLHR
jgi:hypothetical protein